MKHNRGYDEVMIVNPYDPQSTNQQTNLMTFHATPEMGYYAAPTDYGYYADSPEMMGYYAAEPGAYGYYADQPEMGWYADSPEMMGYYAAEPGAYGYYADQPEMGWYADSPEMGYYGDPGYGYYSEPGIGYYGDQHEPIGYYADEWPMGWYGDSPDLAGYGDYQPFSDYGDEMSYYAQPEMAGYVRQTAPVFNPGCPIPTNVAGYNEGEQFAAEEPFAGYQRPMTVNASCGQFTPQPGVSDSMPDTFRPLW
jgi:hypothetical protein